jgi:hypothetical protein
MFPVRYEHCLHIKGKVIPAKGRGGLRFLCGTNIIYIQNSTAIPVTGRERLCFLCGTNII